MKLSRAKPYSALLCVCLILALLVTGFLFVLHSRCHCIGPQCEICAVMEQVQTATRFLGGILVALLTLAACYRCLFRGLVCGGWTGSPATPVYLGVRSNQ